MKFNKVEITSDINKLEESFYSFMNQSEDKRIESDKYVKETTGYNNYDLYRKMRYLINNNLITESVDADDVDYNNDWNEYNQFNRMSQEEYSQKLQQTKNYNVSLNRVIIAPIHYSNAYGKDVLNDLYNQYNKLDQDNKNLSDYISTNIWGYSVKDIYSLMLNYLDNTTNFEPEDYSNIIVRECVVRGDQLGAEILKQNGYNVPDINNSISNAYLPSSMPYFTSDDFYANYMDMDKIDEAIENNNYYSTVKKLQEEYTKTKDEKSVLEMGWNPAVKVTRESMKHAVNRHVNWFNEHKVDVIDLYHNIKINEDVVESLNEASNAMKRLYAEKDIYPVYIVLSYVGGWFGAVQRVVRKVHYTHAGLALDSNIKQIYTFAKWKVHGKPLDGFGVESLDAYIEMNEYALVDILCIFVDGETLAKIKETIQYFLDNRKRSKYNIPNILNILFGRKVESKPENVSMVCSQFTDFVLKTVNINLTKKPSNLVEPNDFEVVKKNPKVYRLYDGYATRYSEKRAESYIKLIFKKEIRDQILVQNNKFNLNESTVIDKLIQPEYTLMSEGKLPIKINSNGDITIKQYKTLEEEYQESHKILKGYGKTNIEGIKGELAKLFYINTILERKIKFMKKENEVYKKTINLRARILNDFKKYFKIVSQQDSTFDFGKYYENSEYGSYTIDGKVLKNVGQLFIQFLANL